MRFLALFSFIASVFAFAVSCELPRERETVAANLAAAQESIPVPPQKDRRPYADWLRWFEIVRPALSVHEVSDVPGLVIVIVDQEMASNLMQGRLTFRLWNEDGNLRVEGPPQRIRGVLPDGRPYTLEVK